MDPDRKPGFVVGQLGNALEHVEDRRFRIVGDDEDENAEVLIIDDSSSDATYALAERLRLLGSYRHPLTVLTNPVNQGYGGNQKLGYHYAIEHGFDYVALLHGDGQYAPEMLPDLLEPRLANGCFERVE